MSAFWRQFATKKSPVSENPQVVEIRFFYETLPFKYVRFIPALFLAVLLIARAVRLSVLFR